jgi:hypothetical protein
LQRSAADGRLGAMANTPSLHFHPRPAPTAAPAAPVTHAQLAKPVTHVLVPVATIQAIRDTLHAHAETLAALLPTVTAEDKQAAIVAATAQRLKVT